MSTTTTTTTTTATTTLTEWVTVQKKQVLYCTIKP